LAEGAAAALLQQSLKDMDSRLRGNDGARAGMTVQGAGMTVQGAGMTKGEMTAVLRKTTQLAAADAADQAR
jgi:hypothetical protein